MPRYGLGQPENSVLVEMGVCIGSLCWSGFGSARYNFLGKVSRPPGVPVTCQFESFRNVFAFQVVGLNGIIVPCQVEGLPVVPVLVYLEVYSSLCSGHT